MAKFYSHYWAKSKRTAWTQCEFTESQSYNSPSITYIEGKGYVEESAQRLINGWNAGGRRMGDMGYEYSLTPPADSV